MYEVFVSYTENGEDSFQCESKPSISVKGGIIFLDGGKGQKLVIAIDTLVYLKIKYPLPDKVPEIKYETNIHYHTETEDVEIIFSSTSVNITVDGYNDCYTPVVMVKEGDAVIRIINSSFLRDVKVVAHQQ